MSHREFWVRALTDHRRPTSSTALKVAPYYNVISCVDTRSARADIAKLVGGNANVTYWLDLGNGADGGQFVLGQPWNRRNPRRAERLRTASELFPEIADTTRGEIDAPSCSVLEALERQEPFVNQTLASHALALLARLFRHGGLNVHGAFVSVAQQRVQPLAIDPSLWRKVRKRRANRTGKTDALSAESR